jgi:hypothetical protein
MTNPIDPIRDRTHDAVELQLHSFLTSALRSVCVPADWLLGRVTLLPIGKSLVGCQSFSGRFREERNLLRCVGMEVRPLGGAARSEVAVLCDGWR